MRDELKDLIIDEFSEAILQLTDEIYSPSLEDKDIRKFDNSIVYLWDENSCSKEEFIEATNEHRPLIIRAEQIIQNLEEVREENITIQVTVTPIDSRGITGLISINFD